MVSLISITTISTFLSGFESVISGVSSANSVISNLQLNHILTRELYDKCADAVNDLEKIDPSIKNTGRGVRLAKCICESIQLCHDYENKWKIIKIFTSQSDEYNFYIQHVKLSFCLSEFINSSILTRDFESNQNKLIKYYKKIIFYQDKCIQNHCIDSDIYIKKINKYKNKI